MSFYILSIFLSAFLLFQIQPLIGKFILPWFGGTSAVWSTIMLFFQCLLTGGYAYAYWLVKKETSSKRYWVHFLLLIISLTLLIIYSLGRGSPILPEKPWQTIDPAAPVWDLLILLFLSIGLPGFILAANSTLVQTWFRQTNAKNSPYWLYSLSNAGSLLALLSYPLFFEPNFSLAAQSWIWVSIYLVFCLVTLYLLIRLIKEKSSLPPLTDAQELNRTEPKTFPLDPLMWVGLSMAGSILLLSTTSRLTQEVAPIPLLWVLPLAVYLLSFVFGFSGKNLYRRSIFIVLLILTSAGVIFDIAGNFRNFYLQLAIYLTFLFSACMVAHGELYKIRPAPSRLARYYLLISIGGAGGGITVSLIAPLIFNGYWEFYLGWTLLFALLFILGSRREPLKQRTRLGKYANLGLAVLSVGLLVFSLNEVFRSSRGILYSERNFYGVSQVSYNEYRDAYTYINGATMHGFQPVSLEKRRLPTAYFWRGSGIAMVIYNHPAYRQQMKVGVMGLGIGTLAAHAQPGDDFRFYEINPEVIELAGGKGEYFSYLKDSAAEIALIPGDARLSLERELNEGDKQSFDLLVMDAFSSDSVPVHLITREAFEIYLQHLGPEGVIAVNISNNYLDLKPVIWRQAQELGLIAILIDPAIQSYHPVGVRSRWIFLARNPAVFDKPEIHANKESLENYHPEIQLWTDQFSNLLEIIW